MAKRKKRQNYGNDIDNYSAAAAPPAKRQRLSESPMPEGVHHYQSLEEVPWDIQKYWQQGYSIFSKYDEGIWMTDKSWFEVTHESVANTIAGHVAKAAPSDRSIIMDAFCGVGGNTIAFALSRRWKRVYAIEKDPATLACAKHNAKIYGVEDQITWFHGDCFELLGLDETNLQNAVPALKAVIGQFGVVFASPPWGGPGYRNANVFDLEKMEPYNLTYLYDNLAKVTPNMILYLPRTSDLNQIAQKVDTSERKQIVHYCTNGTSRAICAYMGDWSEVVL